jgi:hypothetical protein
MAYHDAAVTELAGRYEPHRILARGLGTSACSSRTIWSCNGLLIRVDVGSNPTWST